MASLEGSTTTVNGKQCIRKLRPTSAVLTTAAAETSTTESTTSTTTSEAQQVQPSVAAAPPPASSTAVVAPPASSTAVVAPPASSSAVVAPPAAAPTSTPEGTEDSIPSPAPPQGNAQNAGEQDNSVAAAAPTSAAATSAAPSSTSTSTTTSRSPSTSIISSDTSDVADTSTSSVSSAFSNTIIVSTETESPLATATTDPQPQQTSQAAASSEQQPNDQPAQATSTGVPSGGSAGIIAPDQSGGGDDDTSTLTLGNQNTNIGAIAGGVVGGVAGIVLISVLLFLCLKRRKSREPFVKWQQRLSEKNEGGNGFLEKMKAVPEKLRAVPERLRVIPAGVGVFLGKLRRDKSGPAQNPYNRQSVRSSVSSVYSVRTNVRSRSISEPPSKWRQQLQGFGDRMPNLKRSRTLLRQENPVAEANAEVDNPFADPEPANLTQAPQIPAPTLAHSTSVKSQRAVVDGLRDQQRAPQGAAVMNRNSRETFASLLDEIDVLKGNGTPEYLKDAAHKRTQSASTALRSHPTSTAYTASVYTNADNPFFDPSDAPPVPKQPLPPNPPRRPSNAYSVFPSFNATSTVDSRESTGSFLLFGEPGPSRPNTNMFSEVSAIPRAGRQSDPFDLDRPEVLRFGISGQREVRASVTRASSKINRTSTVPSWVGTATPGPLRKPSVKR